MCTIYNNKKSLSSTHKLLLTASYVEVNLLVHLGGVVCLSYAMTQFPSLLFIFLFLPQKK